MKHTVNTTTRRSWKLEDAKAHFSELVRRTHSEGPQRVTVRGRDSVVMISVDEFDRLTTAKPRTPLVAFMESLDLGTIDLEREIDRGRDVEL